MLIKLPEKIEFTLNQLKAAGFEGFIVGGCLRDLLLKREPKDWDATTNALPKEIEKTFINSYYNNNFGTVVAQIEGEEIEITTYRADAKYTDKRHPDKIEFGVSLEEDLKRRDFTINAMAYDGNKIIDLFEGKKDLAQRTIRAVGDAEERFGEDALRMLRAIRFACQLNFQIEEKTWEAIEKHAKNIKYVSGERVREELLKILDSDDPYKGFWLLQTCGLLKIIIPELETCVNVGQNKHHVYTVFFHSLLSMQFCPSDDPLVKFAALLHDIGKPATKKGEGKDSTFYQHEYVSAKMAKKLMRRLKFSNKEVERVTHLIRQHMFYYNIGEITDAGVRRIIKRIGIEHLQDLIDLRIGDRLGSDCKKAKPYKLEELERRIQKVKLDPITTSMLAIDGNRIMELLELKPGREVGEILNTLLEEVLEDPSLNTVEYLEKRIFDIRD